MKNKGNDGKGNIPERDLWETKQELWDRLNSQYGFIFDCCASKKNTKADLHSSDFGSVKKEDIMNMSCWMNPPFSKAFEMFEHFFKVVEGGVAIYRCDNMETKIWQELIFPNATWIFIPNRRIAYERMEGNGSRFPSALIGFNVEEVKELGGITLTPSKERGT